MSKNLKRKSFEKAIKKLNNNIEMDWIGDISLTRKQLRETFIKHYARRNFIKTLKRLYIWKGDL